MNYIQDNTIMSIKLIHTQLKQRFRPTHVVWRCLHDPTFNHFDTIQACDGRTDGGTDGRTDSTYTIAHKLTILSRSYLFGNFIMTISN